MNNKISNLKVIKKLGEGGQGNVFIVEFNDKRFALKLLKNFEGNIVKKNDLIAQNIENLIDMQSPDDSFTWPLESLDYNGQYGYLMDIIPKEYKEVSLWLNADDSFNFDSIIILIDASINIVKALNSIRLKGYSYQDLNAGNIFVNPANGKVKICDCDNICPTKSNFGVSGKKGFQAPEVILGKNPDIYSDLFSLALFLYYVWCKDNPFEGKLTSKYDLVTDELDVKLYGENPVFTWDPNNDTNRPDINQQQGSYYLWPMLPSYIKEGFVKTFTKGITDIQNGRLNHNEWLERFFRFRTAIIKCQSCGEENIFDNQDKFYCSNCYQDITPIINLEVNNFILPLFNDCKISKYYIDTLKDGNMFDTVAIVKQNKKYKNILGLQNMSSSIWTQINPDGTSKEIKYNDIITIFDGCKIKFKNEIQGIIKKRI